MMKQCIVKMRNGNVVMEARRGLVLPAIIPIPFNLRARY